MHSLSCRNTNRPTIARWYGLSGDLAVNGDLADSIGPIISKPKASKAGSNHIRPTFSRWVAVFGDSARGRDASYLVCSVFRKPQVAIWPQDNCLWTAIRRG